jgi:SAM-dependent methyltransferase
MTPAQSHQHSLETLNTLNKYQDFMDNLKEITDMGCGYGHDALWFADLIDNQNLPRNIKVNAVDLSIDPQSVQYHQNISYRTVDFTATGLASNSQDFVNAHNCLQLSLSPFHTLLHWHDIMRVDAMLLISIPYNYYVDNHREIQKLDTVYKYNSYFNWTMGSLMMTLVATGFDCRHGYFKLDTASGWIQAAVYKLPDTPKPNMSWYDMCDQKILPLCIEQQILKNGTFKETDIICEWIDHSQYILAL